MAQFTGLAFARSALIDLPYPKELTTFAETFLLTHAALFKKYDPLIEQETLDIEVLAQILTEALQKNFNDTYVAEPVDARTGNDANEDTFFVALRIKAECRYSSRLH